MAQRTYYCLDCGYTWGVDFTAEMPGHPGRTRPGGTGARPGSGDRQGLLRPGWGEGNSSLERMK